MNDWIAVLLASTASMFATGLGVLPLVLLKDRAHDWRAFLVGVAIGAMTVAAVVGLLIPGFDLGTPAEVLGGFAVGAAGVFGVRFGLRHHEVGVRDLRERDMRRAALIFTVLLAHSLPEGFAIGTAFEAPDSDVGLFVILAIALQNVPEGTSIAIPLQDAGVSRVKQFWIATATSFPQPIGAVFAFALVELVHGLLPFSFGFAAGAMLVLVAIEMIPDGFSRGLRRMPLLGTLAGAATILLLEAVVV